MKHVRCVGLAVVSTVAGLCAWLAPTAPASALCPIQDPTCGPSSYTYTSEFSVSHGTATVTIAGPDGSVTCPSTCAISDSQVTDFPGRPTDGWPTYHLSATAPAGLEGYAPAWQGCASVTDGVCAVVNDQPSRTVTLGWVDQSPPFVSLSVPAKAGPGAQAAAYASDNSGVIANYMWTIDDGAPIGAYPTVLGSRYDLGLLSEGTHTISVAATDGSGNISRSATFTTVVDKSVRLSVSTVAPYVASAPTVTITTDSDATMTCDLDGGGFSPCASTWSAGALTEGSHTLTVRAVDDVANKTEQIRSFVLDTTAPALSVTDGPAEDALLATGATSLTVQQVEANPGSFVCRIDGKTVACTPDGATALSGLAAGGHSFTVTATDLAGNTRTLTRHFTVQAPQAHPAVRSATRATLATPARPRAGRRIVLRLTLSAPAGTRAVPSGTVVWKVDGRTVCRTSLASGRASCRTRRLKAGRHTVVATYAGSSAFTPVTVRKAVKVRR